MFFSVPAWMNCRKKCLILKKRLADPNGETVATGPLHADAREALKSACVSPSSCYCAKKHAGDREDKDKGPVRTTKGIQEGGDRGYGPRPMTILANRVTAGTCGRRRIARIMGEYDPQPRIRRREHPERCHRKRKTVMGHLPGNVPDRDPNAGKPLQELVTGITCIPTRRGWRHFGPVLDPYDREVVAYVLSLPIQPDLSQKLLDGLEALGPGSGASNRGAVTIWLLHTEIA